jgi:hypothetical protein
MAITAITDIPITTLTAGETSPTGTGVFDEMMKAVVAHLKVEYDARRITSDTYPQIYLGAMQTALTQAVLFAMQRPMVERQAATEEAKRLLVVRQTKGFDDDALQKLMKQALDSWSVAYSVAKDANSVPDSIKVDVIDNITKTAMNGLGMTMPLPSNPLGQI